MPLLIVGTAMREPVAGLGVRRTNPVGRHRGCRRADDIRAGGFGLPDAPGKYRRYSPCNQDQLHATHGTTFPLDLKRQITPYSDSSGKAVSRHPDVSLGSREARIILLRPGIWTSHA